MQILSIQEQMRDCDKMIADLQDQQSRADQERKDLETKSVNSMMCCSIV
jgi:hypothetical protein